MDEQRVQAYLSLIEKLFGCPSGEEMNILNRHLELMDEGLLQVCEWVAAQLQEEGQDNQAQFVRNVAQKVTAFLRNKESQTQLYGETYSDGFPKTPQEAVRLSEGLSEIEKQEWYEWIETATPEKQAELVDILHSMWLQHQAQAQEVGTFLGQGETEGNQQRDEQRVQAYLWLIQELLACPKGEESDVLIRRQYLIDEGFVQVCGEEVARLQREGRENEAQFVRNVAQEIGEYLNRQASGVSMGEGQANSNETEPEYLNFLMQVLGTIVANEGNPSVVYPLLQQNLDKLNFKFAETLQKWAVQIFDEVGENKSSAIAAIICELADLIQNFPLGNRADNLEIAITAYKIALTGLNYQTLPEEWAQTQVQLGVAYFSRTRGEREENIEFAITHLKAALEIRTRDQYPEQWASNLMMLALVYGQRIRGHKAKNIEQRIVYYEAALQIYNYQNSPKEWALIHQDLAHAYSNRIQGESGPNVEKAIIGYQSALQVYTYELFPEEWAETQMRLGLVYASLLQGDKSENLEIAINHFKAALTVYIFSKFPEKWAKLQTGLGVAYSQRIQGNKSDNLEKAIACQEKALTVYNMENYSYEWVMLQKSLGAAYSNRIQGDKSANQKKAIIYYESALKVYTRETFPEDWADIQMSLGWAYSGPILGDLAENIERAIAYFEAALQVYAQSTFSYEWADAQRGLGTVYASRIRGNKAENLEKAIAFYEAALQVYTREKFLNEWSGIQMVLGNTYSIRIRGNTSENLEKAITFCEAALQVYTPEDFLDEWATTQVILGNAYRNRTEGNKAENIEESIICCERALQVYTHEDFLYEWANIQGLLGMAYCERTKGKRTDNLEKAITYSKSALTVYNDIDFPYEWATTQMNLAIAYSNRIQGKKADNIEQAIAYSKSALTVYNDIDFPYEWAMTQMGLGVAYGQRIVDEKNKNIEKAITFYENALQILSRTNFSYGWARINGNLGYAYNIRITGDRSNNIEQAIASCKKALEVVNIQKFPYDWAIANMALGNAYANRILGHKEENFEQAITFLELALQVFSQDNFPYEWARIKVNMGGVYRERIRGEESQNIEDSISSIKAGLTLITLDIFPQDYALACMALGSAYLDRIIGDRVQNLEQASDCFEEASKIYTREAFPDEWANIKNNLGIAYSQLSMASDQYSDRQKSECIERAIECFKLTLQVHTRNSFPKNYTQTLSNLGLAYLAQSRYYSNESAKKRTALQNAYTVFEQALDTVEYLRGEIISGDEAKRKLNEQWARLYLGMVEVCLELGRYQDAIEYVDRSKARNLTELIATRDAYPGGEIADEDRQHLQELRQAISEEDRRLKQNPNPDYTHISQLREEFQAKYPYKPLKFSDIESLLDDETVILEWYVLNDKFLTFTLTNHSLNLWTSSEEDLDNLTNWADTYIDDYRRHDNSQWRDSLPQRLETLAQILHLDEILANLRQNFPNCQKLILIPHRYLHLFPLHALPVTTEDGEGKFLQDLFPKGVGYAPNCQVLKQAQNRSRPDFNRLFAIQNPTQDLYFTDMEVEAIQSLFNPHQVLKHDQAEKVAIDKETLKNDHCIHFSCHGYFNFQDALKSALILAKSEFTPPPPTDDPSRYLRLEDDKLLDLAKCLTLEDILRLDLTNCRLVTLSACETGITDITSTSDEYVGLPSGFILAGSPNVVSTLWAVADISTAIFMIQFYQTLQQQPELSVVLALRQTQTWLRSATVQDLLDWVDGCAVISPERRKQMQKGLAFGAWKNKLDAKRFESPYFWAAFCAIGA